MADYPLYFKQKVVQSYESNTSYRKLSSRFRVPEKTIRNWVSVYDGSLTSLKKLSTTGRPRIVSQDYVLSEVVPTVVSHNMAHQHINLSKLISLHSLPVTRRTMNNYSLSVGITSKKTKARKLIVDPFQTGSQLDPLEVFRAESRLFAQQKIFVFDEKNFLSNSIPRNGLSLVGTSSFVHVEEEIFPKRVDILHGCGYRGWVGDPLITTQNLRVQLNAKGFNSFMVESWLADKFFPSIEKIGQRNSCVMFDQATCHHPDAIRDLFEDSCAETAGGILVQPPGLAKYCSPLDNGAHSWMELHFRSKLHTTDFSVDSMLCCIESAREETPSQFFANWYRNCDIGQ